MKLIRLTIPLLILTVLISCGSDTNSDKNSQPIKLMTLNPGHFHAALVQKTELEGVDSTVHIFAPEGDDLDLHLQRISSFNNREHNPTNWNLDIYTGGDYLQQMLENKPGNVMVTAGNNRSKTDYIFESVDAGINVLSDKPMAIDSEGWDKLVDAFAVAKKRGVLLYDIMTERHEVTSRVQRLLSQNAELFGTLKSGTAENPAIVKESVHHLYKIVSGEPLKRPAWYFDTNQQGEGIVDVTTHLVDLSLWGAFPDEAIDYEKDVEIVHAERWPTMITEQQFENITGHTDFPEYLNDNLSNGVLSYYSNGEITFTLRGHHVKVSVEWNYQAPDGAGDTHYSLMRGSKANLVIRQGADQNFVSTLYVEPSVLTDLNGFEQALQQALESIGDEFPGITYSPTGDGFRLNIPEEYYLGHEAHFGKVAQNFFSYLEEGALPGWEIPNMITKYYITTQARELAMGQE